MSQTHVIMLLSNPFRPDPRVAKEAKTLTQAGYEVRIVCWDREGNYPRNEDVGGFQIQRIQSVQTDYGAGIKQVIHTPRFWSAAIKKIHVHKPDVIHCHDLDTLPIGWVYKRHSKVHLVYDAHEDYPALMSLYLPKPMVYFLSWLEQLLLNQVDHVITASTVFADKLRSQGVERITTIGNYPPLEVYKNIDTTDVVIARSQLRLTPEDFVIAYIGGFTRNRQLLPLIEAVEDMPNVKVIFWGDGHQRDTIESRAASLPNVRYLGWLPADQVPIHTRLADVIYYCLLPDYPGAAFNAPNSLSNAMASGRPVIANDVGDLGRMVRETGCGVLVPEVSPKAIHQAINILQESGTYQKMSQAGRAAAKAKYNWSEAELKLNQLYNQLLDQE